jgi:Protein of unknown function (DUF3500)
MSTYSMRRALATCMTIGVAVAGCAPDPGPGAATAATTPTQSASSSGAGRTNTDEVVAAANVFLATLSDEQRDTVGYDFTDEAKKSGWSNFPVAVAPRNGIALGDLTEEQKAAALAVMEAALSDKGYQDLLGIRQADNYLSANQAAGGGAVRGQGGGGQGPGVSFGEGLYYLAFFGEPSETEQFTVQFGGHHAAYNITYDGADVTLSPTLTGIEPTQFDFGGQSYTPLADKGTSIVAALVSLGESELADAEISGSYDDLLLGPGNDGPFPEPEGILVSGLTQAQQDKITAVLHAWVGDLDDDAAEGLVAKYVSEYDQTYLGWSGGTTLDNAETYVRVDGPSVWIEFSGQPGAEIEGVHPHTIIRDQTADYGWN